MSYNNVFSMRFETNTAICHATLVKAASESIIFMTNETHFITVFHVYIML